MCECVCVSVCVCVCVCVHLCASTHLKQLFLVGGVCEVLCFLKFQFCFYNKTIISYTL